MPYRWPCDHAQQPEQEAGERTVVGRQAAAAGVGVGVGRLGAGVGVGVTGSGGVVVAVGSGVGEGRTVAMLPGVSPPTFSTMRAESFASPACAVIHSSPAPVQRDRRARLARPLVVSTGRQLQASAG